MKTKWHTKHFKNAFKILKESKSLLLVAPFSLFIGMGALIDATLAFLQIAYVNPEYVYRNIVSIVTDPKTAIVIFVILIAAVIAQNIVIVNVYTNDHKKRMRGWRELKTAVNRLAQSLTVHLVTSFLLFTIFTAIVSLPTIANSILLWILVPLTAIAVLVILTAKMIVLQMAVGGGRSLSHSIKATWEALTRSPGAIVEHNAILCGINILFFPVALIVLYLATLTITISITMVLTLIGVEFTATLLAIPIFVVLPLVAFISGVVAIFNMATWAELTKSLRRRALPSAINHLFKR